MSMNETESKQFYDTVASGYDKCVLEKTGYSAHMRVPTGIIMLLGAQEAHVLDLGCGTGLGSTLFFQAGYKVTGIDHSQGMIEVAKQKPFEKLICQSIEEDFQVPDASFDAIIALGVMEFIKDPEKFLLRIKDKLKPGGLCGITFPTPGENIAALNMQSYTNQDFEKMAVEAGLGLLSSEEFFGWESGHLGKLAGHADEPNLRIEYGAVILCAPGGSN